MDIPNRNDTGSCTHGRRRLRHPPDTTSIRFGFRRPRGPMPPVLGRNDFHGIYEAGLHSDDGKTYQHLNLRYHYYDTYENNNRILTIGK